MTLDKILADLSNNEKPLANGRLTYLSALSKEEVRVLEETWRSIELPRRHELVERLVDLAEDNAGLDFHAVFRLCLQDPEPAIQVMAIEGLWECEGRWLLVTLERLLACDQTVEVRAAAAGALGRFTLRAELGKLRPEEKQKLEDVLFTCIGNTQEPINVRRRAVEAVGHLSQERVTAVIEDAY
ncbi:MAG: HEAT repeat domain-containing protein, partial [Dehalococcoidia bacterium]|nr:HEAT repeat domain-containing protein [Dehalococcoidia bacterium]